MLNARCAKFWSAKNLSISTESNGAHQLIGSFLQASAPNTFNLFLVDATSPERQCPRSRVHFPRLRSMDDDFFKDVWRFNEQRYLLILQFYVLNLGTQIDYNVFQARHFIRQLWNLQITQHSNLLQRANNGHQLVKNLMLSHIELLLPVQCASVHLCSWWTHERAARQAGVPHEYVPIDASVSNRIVVIRRVCFVGLSSLVWIFLRACRKPRRNKLLRVVVSHVNVGVYVPCRYVVVVVVYSLICRCRCWY